MLIVVILTFSVHCVHLFLEDVSAAGQSKWKSIPLEFYPRSAEGAELIACFVKNDLPITTSCIKNAEVRRAADLGYYVIYSPSIVCIMFHSFIEIPWIEA